MRNEKIKTHIVCSIIFFNLPFLWDSVAKYCGSRWHYGASACWICMATNTPLAYVILKAFPLSATLYVRCVSCYF